MPFKIGIFHYKWSLSVAMFHGFSHNVRGVQLPVMDRGPRSASTQPRAALRGSVAAAQSPALGRQLRCERGDDDGQY